MRQLRAMLSRLFNTPVFWVRCLLMLGMTPRQLDRLFFQLSDLGKVFEQPTEVMEGVAVYAMQSHVMIYTPLFRLAMNHTDTRGLALQVGPAEEREGVWTNVDWAEVYRSQSHQVVDGTWTLVVSMLPEIIKACKAKVGA